jgi:carbon storage regulator CsrA
MLVLKRKAGTEIIIGDEVVITVLSVQGNTVRLGISAPREVRIRRGELRERLAQVAEAELTEPARPLA